MGAGILMSIIKTLVLLAKKDLYLGVQGSLRLHGFRVGGCVRQDGFPFFEWGIGRVYFKP